MNTEKNVAGDLLDILFENRNKEYGAYALRRFYAARVKLSIAIMLALATVLSAFTFLPHAKVEVKQPDFRDSIVVRTFTEDPIPEAPKPPAEPVTQKAATSKFLTSIAIVKEKDSADQLDDISLLRIGSITDLTPPGVGGPLGTVTGEPAGDPEPVQTEVVNNRPEENPDVQASFPGGMPALQQFLQRNLRSPRDLEDDETISVKVKFVVDFDGNLQGFDVVQDGGEPFNNEVLRVLKKMPRWVPGKKGGRNVPVYYCVPVKFTGFN